MGLKKKNKKNLRYAFEQVPLIDTCHDTKHLPINGFVTDLEVFIKVCKFCVVSSLIGHLDIGTMCDYAKIKKSIP